MYPPILIVPPLVSGGSSWDGKIVRGDPYDLRELLIVPPLVSGGVEICCVELLIVPPLVSRGVETRGGTITRVTTDIHWL